METSATRVITEAERKANVARLANLAKAREALAKNKLAGLNIATASKVPSQKSMDHADITVSTLTDEGDDAEDEYVTLRQRVKRKIGELEETQYEPNKRARKEDSADDGLLINAGKALFRFAAVTAASYLGSLVVKHLLLPRDNRNTYSTNHELNLTEYVPGQSIFK